MMGKQGKHSESSPKRGTSTKKPQDSTKPITDTEQQTDKDTPVVKPLDVGLRGPLPGEGNIY